MENNHLNEQEVMNKEKFDNKQQISPFSIETNYNKNLTNEEKLEYLNILIQNAEKNLKANNINKKMSKRRNI